LERRKRDEAPHYPHRLCGIRQAKPILDLVTDEGTRVCFGNVKPESVNAILDSYHTKGEFIRRGLLGQHRKGHLPLKGVPFMDEHPFFKKQVKFASRNLGIIDPDSLGDYREGGRFRGLENALRSQTSRGHRRDHEIRPPRQR
jgi:NADH-quinone oxidoreductase subunit F